MLERLHTELTANSALAAATSMAEGQRPQGTDYPFLSYTMVSKVWASASHSGPGALYWMRVQFEAWAQTPEEAREVITLLIAALGTIDLTFPVTSPATVVSKNRHQFLGQMSDQWTDPEPIVYRELLDVKIWAKEEE